MGRSWCFHGKELQPLPTAPPPCLYASHRRRLLTQPAAIQYFSPHICSCVASSTRSCVLFKHASKTWLFVLKPITMASEFINNIIHLCNIIKISVQYFPFFNALQYFLFFSFFFLMRCKMRQTKVKSSVISGANFISDRIFLSA